MYLTISFETEKNKSVVATVCVDLYDYSFELEEFSIDRTCYPISSMPVNRRLRICGIISNRVNIPEAINEEKQYRRESYELSFLD